MTTIVDSQARAQAINPYGSYIVQAPAGSGKTELLIQRILALLAVVDEPEEILALTFTRKAAAEMRERVLKALYAARGKQPAEPHALTTWSLATKVLQRSETLNWKLMDYPARLRVMTLDALAASLARQLPVLSGFGQIPATSEDAEPMYQQAVCDLMALAKQQHAPQGLTQAMNTLILHQDCHIQKLQNLLASMLGKREQWLPYVLRFSPNMNHFRQHLQQSLKTIIEHTLVEAEQSFHPAQKHEVMRLAHFAATELHLHSAQNPLAPFLTMQSFPDADASQVLAWKALVYLLTTGTGKHISYRKRVDKRQGFPATDEGKANKEALSALINALQNQPALLQQLMDIQNLPDTASFDDMSWHTLESLFMVLKMLAGQLWQTFAQHKQVDFIEIMLRAKQALGQTDSAGQIIPSDALLRLDYQIKHILIDEFQDTSDLQIDLLSYLTAGWNDGDNTRSFFMVGDPMQSIYRFRKAEVSLFLKAANNALPLPKVTPLVLQQNFRSSPEIITWVNQAFTNIFPKTDDVLSGAIAYTPSQPFQSTKGKVALNLLSEKSDQQEADLIVNIIQTCKQQARRVGVLARSRSHLKTLMQTLQAQGIAFRALDILPLHQQPEIKDLLNLTTALLYPADSVAWASILRAPWLGLSINHLFQIFQTSNTSSWQTIQDYCRTLADSDEKKQLAHFIAVLEPSLKQARRIPIRQLVESTWLRLHAPATLDKTQLCNTDVFFNLLQQLDHGAQVDLSLLSQRLKTLYAKPETKPGADQVELLTMHSAKGLQWDTVILCGLGKKTRAKDKDVLVQTEVNTHQGNQLLFSPLPQHDHNQTYDLIRNFEKQRDELEVARLLYVACTRAERELVMFGEVSGKDMTPASSSLLAKLWCGEHDCYGADIITHPTIANKKETQAQANPQKLPSNYTAPLPYAAIPTSQKYPNESTTMQLKPEFHWAGATAKAIGIALHAALQHVANIGLANYPSHKHHIHNIMRVSLHREGLGIQHFDKAFKRCQYGLNKCIKSTRFAWLLDESHQDKHCEWALTYVEDGICKHMVLDYSFIDKHGTRWIIDYKTGSHFETDVEDFLDQELYRYTVETPQLPQYVRALQALEPERTIKAALYFPMLDGWREWQPVVT